MCEENKKDDAKIKSLEVEITRDNYVSPGVTKFAESFLNKIDKCKEDLVKEPGIASFHSSLQTQSNFFNNVKIFVGELLKKYHFTHDISETDKEGYYNVTYSIGSIEDYEEVYKEIAEFKQSDSDINSIGFSYNGEEISFDVNPEEKDIAITCRFSQNGKKYQILKDDFVKAHTFKSCISDGEMSIVEIKLYRIQALKTFTKPGGYNPVVHVGELGGYVESEDNLSHEGSCWLFDKARVKDGGKVLDDAIVYDKCLVSKNSIVRGGSVVGGHCFITNQSVIIDSRLEGNVIVNGHSTIHSRAYLYGEIGVDQSNIGGLVNLIGRISVKKSKITAPLELSGDYELNFDVSDPHSVIGYNVGMPGGRLFAIKNIVASKVEDKWSTGDFVGTGEELIDFIRDSDDEQRINYVRSIVDNHLNFFKLKGN